MQNIWPELRRFLAKQNSGTKLKFLEESFAWKSSVRNKLKVGDLIQKFSGRKVLAHKKLVLILSFLREILFKITWETLDK